MKKRTGLIVKKTYCDGDFCGYNSGEEKIIMSEFDVGTSMTMGEASAVAIKIARDAREGTRKLNEEVQAREREQLARLGIVPDRDRVLDDENNVDHQHKEAAVPKQKPCNSALSWGLEGRPN